MKRTTLISASLLLAFAGCTCSHGWRPNFLTRFSDRIHGVKNVGEPCDAGCRDTAMSAPVQGCDTCNTYGYGGYDDVQPGVQYGAAPSSYPTGPSTITREPIGARKAN